MLSRLTLNIHYPPRDLIEFGIDQEVCDRLHGFDLSDRVCDVQIVSARGAFADVSQGTLLPPHAAKDKDKVPRRVALKRMRFYLGEQIKTIFEKEVYVWSKLEHENIAPFLGYSFDEGGYPLLASPWMERGSAWDFVNRNPNVDVLPLVIDIAEGLNYLHEKVDLIHSDIKAANVLISGSGPETPRALLCDFGGSRINNASLGLGQPSTTEKGTIRWLAYELIMLSGSGEYTKETDVWAFGMTIYELLTRQKPYQEYSSERLVPRAIGRQELPLFGSGSDDPKKNLLKKICERCWDFEPKDRITMPGVLDTLHRATQIIASSPQTVQDTRILSEKQYVNGLSLVQRLVFFLENSLQSRVPDISFGGHARKSQTDAVSAYCTDLSCSTRAHLPDFDQYVDDGSIVPELSNAWDTCRAQWHLLPAYQCQFTFAALTNPEFSGELLIAPVPIPTPYDAYAVILIVLSPVPAVPACQRLCLS